MNREFHILVIGKDSVDMFGEGGWLLVLVGIDIVLADVLDR